MPTPILDSNTTWIIGEQKPITFEIWDSRDGTVSLAAATATIAVYAKDATEALAEGSATITGTTTILASKLWDTSSLSPGSYRAVCKVTFAGALQIFQATIVLVPLPAP